MFTGIIESVGKIKAVAFTRLETSIPAEWTLATGESVAVNGVCLTVTSFIPAHAIFDLSQETFRKTALGLLRKSSPVNLERAMKADGRFSGHFVTGHVDGLARILNVSKIAGSFVITVAPPPAAVLVEKGSVALNGISLTVFEVTAQTFKAAIIPHTWENTTLNSLRPGDMMNIEFDVLGKYALKNSGVKLTREFLTENGF